jgi:hypothetical protein
MIISQATLEIISDSPIEAHGSSVRGYFAHRFPNLEIIHNHKKDGSLLYLYPRIQYRIIKGKAYILGIEEGVDLLKEIEPEIDSLELKGKRYPITQKRLVIQNANLGLASSFITYRFIKPWLALNEENFSHYKQLKTQKGQRKFLENILIGNLLSLSKSIGYIVDGEIKVTINRLKEIKTSLKGTPMLGFLGTFSVNFEIPDYWGIGKSVSRGFGTVVKINRSDK